MVYKLDGDLKNIYGNHVPMIDMRPNEVIKLVGLPANAMVASVRKVVQRPDLSLLFLQVAEQFW